MSKVFRCSCVWGKAPFDSILPCPPLPLCLQESSQDERSAAALHAVHLDDKYGGAPVQVRVVQGKEPDHFLLVFRGRMVVHSGGRASGFTNRFDSDSYDVDGTRLFHVRGTNEFDTRAVQVEEKASSLNSNDCFVLETPKATYIWYGKVSAAFSLSLSLFLYLLIDLSHLQFTVEAIVIVCEWD